jgi:ribose transport system substrate-binding protein
MRVKLFRARMGIAAAVFGMITVLVLSACGGGSSSSGGSSTGGGEEEHVNVVLSNNFMGNEWRPQMVNDAEYVATVGENKKDVSLDVKIAEGSPSAQIASLQGIIREEPDAIIIDASSATALNPTVQSACDAGILVVSFDQEVTAPCAYKVPENYETQAGDMLSFVNEELGGEGEILIDEGLAGTPLSEAFAKVWKEQAGSKYPGLKIVGSFNSEYAEGPEEQGVAAQLTQHPNATAVLSDYGCASIIEAYKKAGATLKAAGCSAGNRSEIFCEEAKVACFFYGAPAWVGAFALEQAVKTVQGKEEPPKKNFYFETNFVNKVGSTNFPHEEEVEVIKEGYSYFPKESPSLVTPVTGKNWEITPEIALGK